jgi:hypothetical protein
VKLSWLGLAFLLSACGGRSAAPPSPDDPGTRPPDLTGSRVMVLPAQHGPNQTGGGEPVPGLDREIEFWLRDAAPRVSWVFPPEIDRALARSPSLRIDIRALAVSSFHRARVENIGDPLFGDLRSLNALVDARVALIPVAATFAEDSTGNGRVELAVALIDTLGGRVIWFGTIAGENGAEGSPNVAASAARALARRIAG